MEVVSLTIFGTKINGADVTAFCKLSRANKKKWIKANTNMKDDAQIEEWLDNPTKPTGDCGCGCK